MVRMVIFTLKKSNHAAALIFSPRLPMVIMVINVYIIIYNNNIVYIYIYTIGIIKVIRSFFVTIKNGVKKVVRSLDYQHGYMVRNEI